MNTETTSVFLACPRWSDFIHVNMPYLPRVGDTITLHGHVGDPVRGMYTVKDVEHEISDLWYDDGQQYHVTTTVKLEYVQVPLCDENKGMEES